MVELKPEESERSMSKFEEEQQNQIREAIGTNWFILIFNYLKGNLQNEIEELKDIVVQLGKEVIDQQQENEELYKLFEKVQLTRQTLLKEFESLSQQN